MTCRECPVYGTSYYAMTGKSMCFCSGKASTVVEPDADCQYGIEDYLTWIISKWRANGSTDDDIERALMDDLKKSGYRDERIIQELQNLRKEEVRDGT